MLQLWDVSTFYPISATQNILSFRKTSDSIWVKHEKELYTLFRLLLNQGEQCTTTCVPARIVYDPVTADSPHVCVNICLVIPFNYLFRIYTMGLKLPRHYRRTAWTSFDIRENFPTEIYREENQIQSTAKIQLFFIGKRKTFSWNKNNFFVYWEREKKARSTL